MDSVTLVFADSGAFVRRRQRKFCKLCLSCANGNYGGSAYLFVPGDVAVFFEYNIADKAGICDGSQIYRIYSGIAFGHSDSYLDLVLFFTPAHHIYMAGHLVLLKYLYDRKSA